MAGLAKRTVTIANAASLSGKIDMENYRLVGLIMPAAWTAANITLLAAHPDGGLTGDPPVPADGDFFDVYDKGGTEYIITAAASRYISLSPLDLAAVKWVRLRSGTAAVPVAQGAARTIMVLLATG